MPKAAATEHSDAPPGEGNIWPNRPQTSEADRHIDSESEAGSVP
jgi:hypothetical protein